MVLYQSGQVFIWPLYFLEGQIHFLCLKVLPNSLMYSKKAVSLVN
jgi:hypothetical protein